MLSMRNLRFLVLTLATLGVATSELSALGQSELARGMKARQSTNYHQSTGQEADHSPTDSGR